MDLERVRFQIQSFQPIQVTPLVGATATMDGHILTLTGTDMELVLNRHLAAGTAVRVQAPNWLMLGEVLYCVPERSRHKARLRLEHALPGLGVLTDMNRRFFGQTTREPQHAPAKEGRGYSGWT